jgi:hypothetical protein
MGTSGDILARIKYFTISFSPFLIHFPLGHTHCREPLLHYVDKKDVHSPAGQRRL